MLVEQAKLRLTVEGHVVVVVLDRPQDAFVTPWQDARRVLRLFDECIRYAAALPIPEELATDEAIAAELGKIKVTTQHNGVVLQFPWADRLALTWRAAGLLSGRLKAAIAEAQAADNARHPSGVGRIMREMHARRG
jgi:hypothetical protein